MRGFILIFVTFSQLFIIVQMNKIPTNSISFSAESDSGSIEIPVIPKNRNNGLQNSAGTTHGTGILKLVAIFAVILTCNAATMHKRDTDQTSVISDASTAIDKIFEDLNKSVQQLAKDGIDFNSILQNVTAKANQFGEQIQTLGKEFGTKVQEAAKQQGIGA
ncbi:hypothetical protein CBL_02352 [Carabus blaptoides fortunei]